MDLLSQAADFASAGVRNDEQKFESFGVDPTKAEATPFYVRWIREDLAATYFVISKSHLETKAILRIIVVLLLAIAVPLWIIALR